MTPRTPKAHILAAAAASAAIAQLVATLELSLSSHAAVVRAAREGPVVYLLAAGALAISALALASQQARSLRTWALLGLPGLLAAVVLLRLSGTPVGLAYYGERLLHHFLAALCACACVAITVGWARDPALGRLRAVPAIPAVLGAVLLLREHLTRPADLSISLLGQVGTASLLLAAPLALACLWPQLQPPRLRLALLALMVPLAVRCALGGASTLSGLPLGTDAAAPILGALGLAALAGVVLIRPRAEPGFHLPALGLAGLAVYTLHRGYTQRFGDLEAVVGGLARSLLGFEPPYPGYLPGWQVVGAMLVLFTVFALTTTALLSRRDHTRGLCLVILVAAGLGLSSPQLVLMTGAGLLLATVTLVGAPAPAPRHLAPPAPLDEIAADAAELLKLPAPTVLEQQRGAVVVLRGDLDRVPVELRARQDRGAWKVILQAGLLGRGAPDLELLPGHQSHDPHPLVAGHRVRGDLRRLERIPESLLLALARFPEHRTRVWPGGCQVDLGPRLEHLDPATLASVLRGMSEST